LFSCFAKSSANDPKKKYFAAYNILIEDNSYKCRDTMWIYKNITTKPDKVDDDGESNDDEEEEELILFCN